VNAAKFGAIGTTVGVMLLLAGCDSSNPNSNSGGSPIAVLPSSNPNTSTGSTSTSVGLASGSSGLYGLVSWPDGSRVRRAQLDFYPYGLTDSYTGGSYIGPAGHNFRGQTDTAGRYDVSNACNGVTCPSLFAFLVVPWRGALSDRCFMPLIPQNRPGVNPTTPQVLQVTPPSQLNYAVVSGYCQDLESEYLGGYTDTNSNDSYHVLPLTNGDSAPTWRQVEHVMSGSNEALAVGDPCVVGRWFSQHTSIDATLNDGSRIQLVGGANAILTISGTGASAIDYSTSKPYVGNDNGQSVEIQFAGTATSQVRATPPSTFTESIISQNVTYWFIINGQSGARQQATLAPSNGYSCTSTTLTESTNGVAQSYTKG